MMEPPADVRSLAQRRQQARVSRDFAAADSLRDQIGELGWQIADAPGGFALRPLPAYPVLAGLADLPGRDPAAGGPDDAAAPIELAGNRRPASVALLIQGWPGDLRDCVAAVLEHAPADVMIMGLDVGNADGAGDVLHELAVAHPGRVEEWHIRAELGRPGKGSRPGAPQPAGPGWGAARTALLRADSAGFHVIMETSTILTGDAISPLLAAAAAEGVVGAGWRGADPDQDLHGFHDAGPGRVTALLGYLLAVRTGAALRAGGFPAPARFYRNADLEFSLRLGREGALVVPAETLAVRQARHRGFHDTDSAYRDQESRRNYARVLKLLRSGYPARPRPAYRINGDDVQSY